MEILEKKHTTIVESLATLAQKIELYHRAQTRSKQFTSSPVFANQRALELTIQDSLIYRFKCCVDTFWKYYKAYLETTEKVRPEHGGPRSVFRSLCAARFISESEAEQLLTMVDARNITSHMYKEEMAQILAHQIPAYYDLMSTIVARHATIAPVP